MNRRNFISSICGALGASVLPLPAQSKPTDPWQHKDSGLVEMPFTYTYSDYKPGIGGYTIISSINGIKKTNYSWLGEGRITHSIFNPKTNEWEAI